MRSNKPLRTGLIGAGYISTYHLAALRRLPNVQIVGVYDVDAARAGELAAKANVPAMPTVAALRDAGADVLHILTPPHTHADLTVEAIELGCHVLLEKPLADSLVDCERIERAAEGAETRVCVDHSLLFDPQVRKALRAVRSGAVGRIVSVDVIRSSNYPPYAGGPLPPQYRKAGYPFRDLGVHALYLLEAFLGPIEHAQGQWSSLGGDPNLAFDEWRAQIRCRDGMGQVHLSWNIRPLQSQIIIHGTHGVMRVDLFLMFQSRRSATRLPKPAERVVNAMTDSLKPLLDVTRGIYGFARGKVLPYHGLQELVAVFYGSLEQDTEVPVSVADAARVARWTEKIAAAADAEHEMRITALSVSERVPVLVTGASGALGSELVGQLQAQGTRVRIMVRRLPRELPEGVEVVTGNLGDPDAVDRAVCGARVVIHAGAATKGGWTEHQCATVTGTKNILDACRKYAVEKLVHISSLSVVDWAGSNDAVDELSPLEPQAIFRGHYTRAKLEAEILVRAYCSEHGLPAVILRPGQIFGGRIPLLTPAVARRIGRWRFVLGDGSAQLPLVYIEDVVDAVLAAARSPLRDGQIIQIVDDVTPTQNQVLASVIGEGERVVHIPRLLLIGAGKVSELALRILRRRSPISAYRLRSAMAKRTFVSKNAKSLLDWTPRIGVRRMLHLKPASGMVAREPDIITEPAGGVAS